MRTFFSGLDTGRGRGPSAASWSEARALMTMGGAGVSAAKRSPPHAKSLPPTLTALAPACDKKRLTPEIPVSQPLKQ